MTIPTDELSLLIREWYYVASEGQAEKFVSYFLPSDETTYFGTDPQEIWHGFEQIKSNLEDNFKTYGKWSIMSKNLVTHQFGDVAVFTDEIELAARYGGSSMAEDARMSGVLVHRNGSWKILQVHLSIGVPNSELLPG